MVSCGLPRNNGLQSNTPRAARARIRLLNDRFGEDSLAAPVDYGRSRLT